MMWITKAMMFFVSGILVAEAFISSEPLFILASMVLFGVNL